MHYAVLTLVSETFTKLTIPETKLELRAIKVEVKKNNTNDK